MPKCSFNISIQLLQLPLEQHHTGVQSSVEEHKLTAYYRDDASLQAGNLQEVMPHETAVPWIRHRESTTRPARPWEETAVEFGVRLRGICEDINQHCDVEGLCRKLPEWVQAVADAQGGRISAEAGLKRPWHWLWAKKIHIVHCRPYTGHDPGCPTNSQ